MTRRDRPHPPTTRLPDDRRWAGVLEAAFGGKVRVVVDGLVGRTTDMTRAEGIGPFPAGAFDGRSDLLTALAAQGPFDLVVIMLGTNDLQAGSVRAPGDVADAAMRLASDVRGAADLLFARNAAPAVLVVAPPPFGDTSRTGLGGLFGPGEAPSRALGTAFAAAAGRDGVQVLDAGTVVGAIDGADGIHLTAEEHAALGRAVAERASAILGLPLSARTN